MSALAVPFTVAAAVLVAGGVSKVRGPVPAVQAMRAAGLPSSPAAVRVAGGVEVALGGWAILTGDALAAAAVAVAYAGFAAFVARLLLGEAGVPSCGCLGTVDTPPSWTHVLVDSGAAAVAGAAALGGGAGLPGIAALDPAAALVAAVLALTGLRLAVLTLTELPRLGAVGRR